MLNKNLLIKIMPMINNFFPAFLLAFVISFVVPITVLYFNASEFNLLIEEALRYNVIIFTLIFIVLTLLTLILKRLKNVTTYFLLVSSIIILYINFFFQNKQDYFDGAIENANVSFRDLIILLVATILLVLLLKYKNKLFHDLVIVSAVITILTLVYFFISLYEAPAINNNKILGLSKTKNVLIFSFDGLQGDLIEELFNDNNVSKHFNGFTSYSNVSSIFPYTKLSVPTMVSGKIHGKTDDDYEKFYIQDNILSDAAKHGYKSVTFTSYLPVLKGTEKYPFQDFNNELNESDKLNEFKLLWKASLSRIYLNVVFNASTRAIDFVFPETPMTPLEKYNILNLRDDNSNSGTKVEAFAFDEYIDKLKLIEDRPVIQFHHYLFTHSPVNLDENCNYDLSQSIVQNRSNMIIQYRCAVKKLARLFKKLKEKNIYDSSLIIVTTDHGGHLAYNYDARLKQLVTTGKKWTVSKYYSSLLIKRPYENDTYQISTKPISLLDISPTICYQIFDENFCQNKKYMGGNIFSDNSKERFIYINVRDPQKSDSGLEHFKKLIIGDDMIDSIIKNK